MNALIFIFSCIYHKTIRQCTSFDLRLRLLDDPEARPLGLQWCSSHNYLAQLKQDFCTLMVGKVFFSEVLPSPGMLPADLPSHS